MGQRQQPLSRYGSKEHNWLIHRILVPALEEMASEHARGYLVDIGCGEKLWAPLLRPYVDAHIGVDHPETQHDLTCADVRASAYATTLPDECADTVWCTAVLEHLERPLEALQEAYRLLKPGGKAIYTVPLFWHLHEEPRDFYRYTRYGLRYLFEQAGFELLALRPLSGFIVTFTQELCYWIAGRSGGWKQLAARPALQLLQGLAYACRRWDRSPEFTWMYLVVAQKPEAAAAEARQNGSPLQCT